MEAVFVSLLLMSIGVLHAHAVGTPAAIVITWNIVAMRKATQYVHVEVKNNYLAISGGSHQWQVGWTWWGHEVIRKATGAMALEYGSCEAKKIHSCAKSPVMVDLLPSAPYDLRTRNCCKGGRLALGETAEFRISIENRNSSIRVPRDFTVGLTDFHCGRPGVISPTRYPVIHGGDIYAAGSWRIICRSIHYDEDEDSEIPVHLGRHYNLIWISVLVLYVSPFMYMVWMVYHM